MLRGQLKNPGPSIFQKGTKQFFVPLNLADFSTFHVLLPQIHKTKPIEIIEYYVFFFKQVGYECITFSCCYAKCNCTPVLFENKLQLVCAFARHSILFISIISTKYEGGSASNVFLLFFSQNLNVLLKVRVFI